MNNLPITSNSLPQSPARGAAGGGVTPAPRPPEGQVSDGAPFTGVRSKPSQASGNAANGAQAGDAQAADARATGPFAALLARQIVEAGLSAPNTAQTAIAAGGGAADNGADRPEKDVRDPAATAAPATDPLAAILLQLPQEPRAPATADAAGGTLPPSTGNGNTNTAETGIAAFKPASRSGAAIAVPGAAMPGVARPDVARPNVAGVVPGKKDAQATVPEKQIVSGIIAGDAAKHAELPANLAQPANTAQAVAQSVISAAMPDMPATGRPTDSPQAVTAPLGSSGWAGEFSQKITWMSTQRNQVAELHLNPPDLGPLNVVLKISDNQATALFTSPHGAVREAVENALPKLREILADNGIMLGNATVSDQSPRDRGMEGSMNQGFGSVAQPENPGDASGSANLSPAPAQAAPVRRHNGMVDTFA